MFPLAHIGIGTHLVPRARREALPWRWLALGCLLPDLIDKPIWLVARWLGAELPHLEIARLFGHTAWLAAAFALAARFSRDRRLTAIAFGIPTHLLLDVVTDWGRGGGWGVWKIWLFWPLALPRLHVLTAAVSPLQELGAELRLPVNWIAEAIGALILLRDLLLRRRRNPKIPF